MTVPIRGKTDRALNSVKKALLEYERQHPDAQVDLYKRNAISIRIRVIDPGFVGLRKSERHVLVWEHLKRLPEKTQGDITIVALLSPDEVGKSLGNLEFEDPSPSII